MYYGEAESELDYFEEDPEAWEQAELERGQNSSSDFAGSFGQLEDELYFDRELEQGSSDWFGRERLTTSEEYASYPVEYSHDVE